MTFTKLTITFAAIAAATPALAHPGHGIAGHIHWEFVAAAIAVVAGGLMLRRRRTK